MYVCVFVCESVCPFDSFCVCVCLFVYVFLPVSECVFVFVCMLFVFVCVCWVLFYFGASVLSQDSLT